MLSCLYDVKTAINTAHEQGGSPIVALAQTYLHPKTKSEMDRSYQLFSALIEFSDNHPHKPSKEINKKTGVFDKDSMKTLLSKLSQMALGENEKETIKKLNEEKEDAEIEVLRNQIDDMIRNLVFDEDSLNLIRSDKNLWKAMNENENFRDSVDELNKLKINEKIEEYIAKKDWDGLANMYDGSGLFKYGNYFLKIPKDSDEYDEFENKIVNSIKDDPFGYIRGFVSPSLKKNYLSVNLAYRMLDLLVDKEISQLNNEEELLSKLITELKLKLKPHDERNMHLTMIPSREFKNYNRAEAESLRKLFDWDKFLGISNPSLKKELYRTWGDYTGYDFRGLEFLRNQE